VSNAEYHTAARGESWKFRLMNVIDSCMRFAASREEFLELMRGEGYEIRWQDSRKYITYTTPEGRSCRDNKLHETKYSKEMMELEFRIRRKIIYGRTALKEFAEQYTDRTSANTNTTGCDSMCLAGSDKSTTATNGITGMGNEEADRTVAGNQEQLSQPSTGGENGGILETDRAAVITGWEGEREAFIAFQNQTAQFSQHQPVSRNDNHSSAATGIVHGLVQLGQTVERDQPVGSVTMGQGHIDHKAMKILRKKKIALGHAEDEQEEFGFHMTM